MSVAASTAHPAEAIIRPSEQALLDAWRQLVEAHAEQVARVRETEPQADFWGAGYGGSTVSLDALPPQCETLAALMRPDDTWLDIGAGFGGTMLPLCRHVRRVTALDPSPGMNALLKENIRQLGITNVDVLEPSDWPSRLDIDQHDVCLASAVIYEVPNIGEFLDAMEQHATRLCVLLVAERGTGFTPDDVVFERLHGEAFTRQPALRETLALLGARRRRCDVQTFAAHLDPMDIDAAHDWVRDDYFVRQGSDKDRRLRDLLVERFGVGGNQVQMPHPAGNHFAVISWAPPHTS